MSQEIFRIPRHFSICNAHAKYFTIFVPKDGTGVHKFDRASKIPGRKVDSIFIYDRLADWNGNIDDRSSDYFALVWLRIPRIHFTLENPGSISTHAFYQ